jgi:diaminopimelate epimerase
MSYHNENGYNDIEVTTLGGNLTVEFERSENDTYHNIWLCGPAERVFEGTLEIK